MACFAITQVGGWQITIPLTVALRCDPISCAWCRSRLSGSNCGHKSFHKSSQLFPIGECHQLVQDFLQPLKPTLVISCRARYLFFAATQVQAIRFTDLRYFIPQLSDAVFD